jgi:hypothetical protein
MLAEMDELMNVIGCVLSEEEKSGTGGNYHRK